MTFPAKVFYSLHKLYVLVILNMTNSDFRTYYKSVSSDN